MSKKVNKKTVVATVNEALDTTKKVASKTNEFALNTTEEVVLGTIHVAGQWQKVTEKALKGGLKLMANQQDLVFNALDMFKGQLVQSKKRLTKVFA
ncbi:hypothetical protein [Winogradskyella sp.]|uniref:hypothetical protein n=1 Tax=Winogradskyella sp. TaxID=1883156 RepID=UPI0025D144A6|nr:hypothetical protein [Winogradskyella sp.]